MMSEHGQAGPDTPSEPAREARHDPLVDVPGADQRRDDAELRRDSAPRRTLLAAERTYLAWLRTGLGAIAVSVAVGRVAPALVGGSNLAYALLGAGYGALGIFFIVYALVRARRLDAALAADAPVTLDWWALAITALMGIVLAIATIVMVLAEV